MSRRGREPAASSPFRDLSNLRTPKPNPESPSPLFFTASKTPLPAAAATPTPRRRRGSLYGGGAAPTPAPLGSRRLRALEVDQSRSARRAESGRERALRAFAASASSWLSLLLRDPSACGSSPLAAPAAAAAVGKRDASDDGERARGCSPKRRRGGDRGGGERRKRMTPAMAASLRESLREVCSLDDMRERMGRYMSTEACEEVLIMMCQICKNIDEGRLKMKANSPLVADLRLKEKATKIFMCYNPEWLRIGLHIVLGGDSLVQTVSQIRDKEVHFLKLILEKQLFAQNVTTKSFGCNKVVEGPHRSGYTQVVGNIILKRIFMLVAALDRAKIESALPLKSGIDGLDGGSPLLFCRQAQIISSRQIIQESLGEVMHGEGDLLMHLMTMGYKLMHQQLALSEYDFTIGNLFKDLEDGIILCRVVQLLISDATILLKVIAPSDTYKKKLHNCTMAIQYIKQAGVPLSVADGVTISAEDIVYGDKELILSLLWDVFLHMQLPLLANRTSVAHEISRVKALVWEQPISVTKTHIDLLCEWVQVICAEYGISVENSSQIDRRALNCFINYYLNVNICSFPLKETSSDCRKELFSCHEPDTMTDATSHLLNTVGKLLAEFLQDFPASDILANDALFDEKCAIVLIAFLSSHLSNDRKLEQLRNLINTRLEQQNLETKVFARHRSQGKNDRNCQSPQEDDTNSSSTNPEWAATVIQTQARRVIAMNKYHKLKNGNQTCNTRHGAIASPSPQRSTFESSSITSSIVSASKPVWEDDLDCSSDISYQTLFQPEHPVSTGLNFLLCKEVMAARKIQFAYRRFVHNRMSRMSAAIKIQSQWRSFSLRICFKRQVQAIITIQAVTRHVLCHRSFQQHRHACIVIQRFSRGWLARRKLLGSCSPQSCSNLYALDCSQHKKSHQSVQLKIVLYSVLRLQRWWRKILLDRSIRASAISIQSFVRGSLAQQQVNRTRCCIYLIQRRWRQVLFCASRKRSVIVIQAHVRGWLAREAAIRNKRRITIIQRWWRKVLFLESRKRCVIVIQAHLRGWMARQAAIRNKKRITIIQRWWRKVLLLESRKRSVIVIQAHVRGWMARQAAIQNKKRITIIQSCVKAYLVRKGSKQEVADVRSRLQKSSAQVDDNMRLINRLVAALSELIHCRSISNIRQTCSTLSIATEYSEKCCETIVAAGAVDILLKQIHLLNRGIPDQEVSKQVLFTLRNIARLPNLRSVLTDTPQPVEIIFQEVLRNKADGFFAACEILKKLCESKEGHEIARALPRHIRRLGSLVQDLEKKVEMDKRNGRTGAMKENNLRRLGEAVTLHHLLANAR